MSKDVATNENTILPQETGAAIKMMIELTEGLYKSVEEETNALAMNDSVNFFMLAEDKKRLNDVYQKATAEVQARIDEFRNYKGEELKKLVEMQDILMKEASRNMKLLESIKKKDDVSNSGNEEKGV